jgi:hypothetical protein
MPSLNEPQSREHPWHKKHSRYIEQKAQKQTKQLAGHRPRVTKEVPCCPICGDEHCYFGECDGREF